MCGEQVDLDASKTPQGRIDFLQAQEVASGRKRVGGRGGRGAITLTLR